MYETYWRLDCRPFESTSDANFYFPSEAHQGALLKLRYAIENGRGAALLAGASGVGKTLLTHTLQQQLGPELQPVVQMVFPQMPADELLAYLADELNPVPADSWTPTGSIKESVRRLESALALNAQRGSHAVIIIDEAHLIDDPRAWEALRLLLNFETGARPALTLLLVGQPLLLPMLERMPQFEERLAVKCLLRPLTAAETVSYVNHRLAAAGARQTIFQPAALEAIYYLAQGHPRRINRLCDLALLIAYAEEQRSISAEHLEAVAQELVTVVPE